MPEHGRGCSSSSSRERGRCTSSSSAASASTCAPAGWPPGSKLPSSRALAAELRLSRGVVLEAYSQLVAEGYLIASQGAPTRVAVTSGAERPPLATGTLHPRYAYRFDPFLPDLASFPRELWLRSQRAASARGLVRDARPRRSPRAAATAQRAHGLPGPRPRRGARARAHADLRRLHAGASRCCAPACAGAGSSGSPLEDPGWPQYRLIAEQAGLETVGIAVDEHGLDVAALERSGCETIVVTPAHQFPTGVVMSSERRAALLAWADEVDGLIVEDDYDSELRYDRGPVGALQGLAPERVCHIGSAAKRLAPGAAARVDAVAVMADRRADLREGTGRRRHVGRRAAGAGRLHRPRRARSPSAQDAPALPAPAPGRAASAGRGGTRSLPHRGRCRSVRGRHTAVRGRRGGADPGRRASPASPSTDWRRRARRTSARPAGIILGYANLSEPAIERGVELLAEALRSL